MNDMVELVIKIPEEDYRTICENKEKAIIAHDTCRRIANGIPLPKGRGDLIDADKMIKELNERIQTFDEGRNEILKQSDRPEENHQIPLWMWKGSCKTCGVIIEADKEYEE